LCSGETAHVCTDREGRVRSLPAWVREMLSR
jgi:acyl-CoA thioesterase FadM